MAPDETRRRSMTTYDAVIVGSGPTGGYAAKTLSEAGLRVCVLEAGPRRTVGRVLQRFDSALRRLGYRIEEDPAAIRRQPIQSSCYAWPANPRAFADDVANPYTTPDGRRFTWIRGRQVGGRMMVHGHGLQFYRFSDLDFKAGERDGRSDPWPLSYADLVPFYERVERWMGVRGSRLSLPQLPDSIFEAEVGLNSAERVLDAALSRQWRDRIVIPGRTARPPLPIADALATKRCTLRTNAIVSRVLVHRDTGRVDGVRFSDRLSKRESDVKARIVILSASAIESARLLLASATTRHPEGLANSSGAVGRYLMDHTHVTGINADVPIAATEGPQHKSWSYIPRFRNVCGRTSAFDRGYGIQVFTLGRQCAFTVFGEMLPHRENRVTLDPETKDAWGFPAARIDCMHRDNEHEMLADAIDACGEMLSAARFEPWRFNSIASSPGLANHEMGTARMGTNRTTSVLNQFCQSWDVKNLFVMDGACFVSQGVANPTLTMMAIAARSCDYLVEVMKRGEL